MKYLLALSILLITSITLAAAPLDRTIFSSLEPGKSKSYDLSIPKGKTSIAVLQTEESNEQVFTCVFSSDGEVGLEQKHVAKCLGKMDLKEDTKVSLKITNASKKTVDFQIKQFTTKH